MTTHTTQPKRHFCIFDIFLDGTFLRWEEVKGNCPLLVPGQDWEISLEDGTKIVTKVIETEAVSENSTRLGLRRKDVAKLFFGNFEGGKGVGVQFLRIIHRAIFEENSIGVEMIAGAVDQ